MFDIKKAEDGYRYDQYGNWYPSKELEGGIYAYGN